MAHFYPFKFPLNSILTFVLINIIGSTGFLFIAQLHSEIIQLYLPIKHRDIFVRGEKVTSPSAAVLQWSLFFSADKLCSGFLFDNFNKQLDPRGVCSEQEDVMPELKWGLAYTLLAYRQPPLLIDFAYD